MQPPQFLRATPVIVERGSVCAWEWDWPERLFGWRCRRALAGCAVWEPCVVAGRIERMMTKLMHHQRVLA
jgi:hypothetical protein